MWFSYGYGSRIHLKDVFLNGLPPQIIAQSSRKYADKANQEAHMSPHLVVSIVRIGGLLDAVHDWGTRPIRMNYRFDLSILKVWLSILTVLTQFVLGPPPQNGKCQVVALLYVQRFTTGIHAYIVKSLTTPSAASLSVFGQSSDFYRLQFICMSVMARITRAFDSGTRLQNLAVADLFQKGLDTVNIDRSFDWGCGSVRTQEEDKRCGHDEDVHNITRSFMIGSDSGPVTSCCKHTCWLTSATGSNLPHFSYSPDQTDRDKGYLANSDPSQ
ncbi:hypothetical protein V8F20_004979 [Naviculisporaceae sp. PSN 640]